MNRSGAETVEDVISRCIVMNKTAVFVDVQNIYYTVKQAHHCHFNYSQLWNQLSGEGEIVFALAYAIDRGDEQQKSFQEILRQIGFTVRLKPYINRVDGSSKGDWDVGLTIDVIDTIYDPKAQIDTLVLLSGDGDFDLLLQRVSRDHKIKTIVYGVEALSARSLIDAASEFRPIEGNLLLKKPDPD